MPRTRYNEESQEWEIIESTTGEVLDDGIEDSQAAAYLCHVHNHGEG